MVKIEQIDIDNIVSAINTRAHKIIATPTADGLLSAADKTKLNSVATNANNYSLPVASVTVLGGVKAGTNIAIDANGVISANDTAVAFTEITSKPTTLVGYGITDASLSTHIHTAATTIANGFMSAADKTKLDGIATSATNFVLPASVVHDTEASALHATDALRASGTSVSLYKGDGSFETIVTQDTIYSLPVASDTVLGGVKAGTNIAIDANGVISANDTAVAFTEITSKPTTLVGYAISDAINVSQKGAVNGVATLDATGLVPTTQLPSFVDDVLEFATLSVFPATGSTGKIYVDTTTNKTYRWSGTVYIYITSGAVDSVAGKTGVVTLVKADVGLGNVDNTTDLLKPVSTATQTALNLKANLASPALTGAPTAPTALAGDNTTQIATTAFVTAALGTAANITALIA